MISHYMHLLTSKFLIMVHISKTDHARNVTTFDKLIPAITGYGETYNPSNESLKLLALQFVPKNSKNDVNTVNAAPSAYSKTINRKIEQSFIYLLHHSIRTHMMV